MRVEILGEHCCAIHMNDGTYLQSYRSIVAFIPNSGRYDAVVYPKWDYSRTTAKHVGQFLNWSSKEIREKIKRGEIKYCTEEPDL